MNTERNFNVSYRMTRTFRGHWLGRQLSGAAACAVARHEARALCRRYNRLSKALGAHGALKFQSTSVAMSPYELTLTLTWHDDDGTRRIRGYIWVY